MSKLESFGDMEMFANNMVHHIPSMPDNIKIKVEISEVRHNAIRTMMGDPLHNTIIGEGCIITFNTQAGIAFEIHNKDYKKV